jgi:uncharacterized membrane protein YhiD involved in acid resistance
MEPNIQPWMAELEGWHILVCVGSATIMLLSIYGFGEFANETNVRMDPARLAAQVITGIGFLGADDETNEQVMSIQMMLRTPQSEKLWQAVLQISAMPDVVSVELPMSARNPYASKFLPI